MVRSDRVHEREHSLEVQLPFLQTLLGSFTLVPLVVGDADAEAVAQVLERLWGGDETLIVISSDLSHYLRYEQARAADQATVRRILALDAGLAAARGLRRGGDQWRAAGGAPPRSRAAPAGLCNSGDTAGDRDRVVGYGAIAFEERVAVSPHSARWWHPLDDGRIQCDLCPRDCRLHEGQRGMCFVRQRVGDAMVLTTYGRSSGFCIDPIEKKPLNHFFPGTSVLSLRHRRLQPGLQVLPELGHLQEPRDGPPARRRLARADRRGRARERRGERGLHLQRPGDLRRVRHGHGRRLPRARPAQRGGDGRLHARRSRGASSTPGWTRPTST